MPNNIPPTDDAIIHRFIRKTKKEMNWRKRSVGLNSIKQNSLTQLLSFETDCISCIDFISRSISYINAFVTIRSKQEDLSFQEYMSSYPMFSLFIRKLKLAAIPIASQLSQVRNHIQRLTVVYTNENTYILTPHQKRIINSLTDSEAYEWTRFTKDQLHQLNDLFRLPERFTVYLTHHFRSEFVLILSLSYFSSADNFSSLKYKFGGNPDFFPSVIKEFTKHLYELFYHKISGDSLSLYSDEDFQQFASVICNKVNIDQKEIRKFEKGEVDEIRELTLLLSQFRPCGCIDDSSIATCRPASGPAQSGKYADRKKNNHEIQKAVYSSYAKDHGLKSQAVNFPNGMWGSVWVCALKHNDLGVLNMSGLCEYLLDVLPRVKDEYGNEVPMVLYGDSIFKPSHVILRRIDNATSEVDKLINGRMNSCRTSVEMMFGSMFNLFKILGAKKKLKLLKNGRYIRKLILVIFFLHNCHTCFNGNTVSSMFELDPPSIEDYLHLDEDPTLHTDDDDEVPLGFTYDYGAKEIEYDSSEDIIVNV